MPKQRSWTDEQLVKAVATCTSYRAVIKKIGLIPAGGNYKQVSERVAELKLSTHHFTGRGWNKGGLYKFNLPITPTKKWLRKGSKVQSHTLKLRLYKDGLKNPKCEICGWAERSIDGRIPVELDHINGDPTDNRLVNLRILCPNCHSLQPTHRGKNKKVALRLQRARVL